MTKAQYWQQHIIDWKKSGLIQAIYCAQSDIKASTLHYWRKKLSPPVQKTNKLIPLRVHSSAPARILLGSCVFRGHPDTRFGIVRTLITA